MLRNIFWHWKISKVEDNRIDFEKCGIYLLEQYPYSTWAFEDMLTNGGGSKRPPSLKARKMIQTW